MESNNFSRKQLVKENQELKALLEPLLQNEQRFINAITATSDAIWEWNLTTNITYYSPRWYEMLGYADKELDMTFNGWAEICHPDDLQPSIDAIQACMANHQSYTVDFRIKTKDKQWKWIRGRGNIVKYDDNNQPLLLSGTNTDISERKQMEEELRHQNEHLDLLVKERTEELAAANEELAATNEELVSSNEELSRLNDQLTFQKEQVQSALGKLQHAQEHLIQAEKMASLGMLAAGVAHEINNPLNFIHGSISAIDIYFDQYLADHKPFVQGLIDGIQIGVKRSVDIVRSLSHYSRNDAMKVSKIDIHQIIDDCLAMLESDLKNKALIVKHYTDQSYQLLGNEGRLHQVFLNILANANQAIAQQGEIAIETMVNDKNFEIYFKDNGSGIAKEHLNKIFDPFFTTKEPGKGTGLGLSITFKIIKEHNGTIEYESRPNLGTKVKVSIPLV